MQILLNIDGMSESLSASDLPLTLGSSTEARFAIPAADRFLLTIDLVDAEWRVSSSGNFSGVAYNGRALARNETLRASDLLTIDGVELRVGSADTNLELSVDTGASPNITAPPAAAVAEGEGESLLAAEYQRRREVGGARRSGGHRWKIAVASALVLFGSLAGALFTAQSVRFETVPALPDTLRISGGWMKIKLGERYLLRPGTHRVALESEGYRDLIQSFELTRDEPLTLRLEQEPLPGQLTISATAGANVYLGDELMGAVPLEIGGLLPDTYSLRLEAPGFLPWEAAVAVSGRGRTDRLDVVMVPAVARVTLPTEPSGAKLLSGDQELGTTDGVVLVPEGRQTLRVALEGYKLEELDVALVADTDVELPPLTLTRADGTLLVKSRPSGANVSVDGKYRGQTPVTVSLSPGQKYLVQLSKAGYGRKSRQVEVRAASGEELLVDLAARNGTFELDIRPADATVYINGSRQSAAQRKFELPASAHRVEVRREGYETWSETLTPRPGFPQRVAVRLRTTDQVRVAGVTQKLTSPKGPVLRYVDHGEFTMGASRREPGRRANETLRQIVLTRGFYIGTREISNAEFRAFKPTHDSSVNGPVTLAGDRNPVVNVSWQDAAAYCNWLSAQEGLTPVYEEKFDRLTTIRPLPNGYRLPTEAEWTWAARYQGGKGYRKFPWGDAYPPPAESGNFADQSAQTVVPNWIPGYNDGFESTAPVASFGANRAGLHDLGGNVAEWVNDHYQVYTPDSSRVWTDPLGPEQAKHNVIRGASWRSGLESVLRFSYRDFGDKPRPDVGFRVARNKP